MVMQRQQEHELASLMGLVGETNEEQEQQSNDGWPTDARFVYPGMSDT
jgi:hypothetical protein